MNVLRDRVEARLKILGLGEVEAAVRVPGLERNYIRDFLRGKKRSFSAAKQPLVARALDWTEAELRGEEPPALLAPPQHGVQSIPLIDAVTAGRLANPSSQIPVEQVPLLAFADLGSGEFFATRVDGTSMDRISPDGSIIVINRRDRTLISGRCYIFAIEGETTYKRWQGGKPAYLEPYSTDPIHKPIFVPRKRDFEVIGRVKRTVLDL